MPSSSPPKLTAIVPTILGARADAARVARTSEVLACLRSILANQYDPFEVVIVDQTPGDALAEPLMRLFPGIARLRYIHTDTPGKSRALNLAITSSDADLFAITDDDCIVPQSWLTEVAAVFQRHPDAGVVYGDVHPPAEHNWAVSFVPELHFASEQRLQPTFLPRTHNLMGANMAFSRGTVQAIGLFDELLGPGSRYAAYHEEVDYHLRALRARPSIGVYVTPAVYVTHEYGARPQGAPARRLLQTYHAGKSAYLTKHALHGDLGAACRLALLGFEPVFDAGRNLVRSGKPSGIGMVAPYMRGIWRGLRVAGSRRPQRPEQFLAAS